MSMQKITITLTLVLNLIVLIKSLLIEFESPDYPNPLFESDDDFRQRFLNHRRQNLVDGKRVELLDKYLSNSSVFVDGIAHHILDENHSQWKEANEIEREYKNLIQMKGITYSYKRGTYWRTWRKVRYPDGNDEIICYRCMTSINSTSCEYGGYWIIEENSPQCPYEILSVINDRDLCASSLFNNTNIEEKCAIIEQFSQLTTACDNPIETIFSVTKDYNVSERNMFPVVICNGRDYCEISTSYMIARDHVTFRIINSTNHLIYSRVMKNGGKNYVCVNCGQINPKTKSIVVTETPITLDLLNKNKRHLPEFNYEFPEHIPVLPGSKNLDNEEGDFYFVKPKKIFAKKHDHKDTCQSLKQNDDDEDFSDD